MLFSKLKDFLHYWKNKNENMRKLKKVGVGVVSHLKYSRLIEGTINTIQTDVIVENITSFGKGKCKYAFANVVLMNDIRQGSEVNIFIDSYGFYYFEAVKKPELQE